MQSFSCFLINLNKDKDRLSFMDSQLRALHISYERLPAINGKIYTFSENIFNDKQCLMKNKRILTRGELGCALSHRLLYERIVRESIPYALILEDDVNLPERLKLIIEKEVAQNEKKESWEYLSFDYYAYGIDFMSLWMSGMYAIYRKKENFFQKIIFSIIAILKVVPFTVISLFEELQKLLFKNQPLRTFRPIYFAGCYVINNTAASKLLSLSSPIVYTADRLPNVARIQKSLRFKIYSPLLVKQEKVTFDSNIA